jgi:hypothetical protein
MSRHASTDYTSMSQPRGDIDGSANSTTNVDVPSVLLDTSTSDLYNTTLNQTPNEEVQETSDETDKQLHEETFRILAGSTSTPVNDPEARSTNELDNRSLDSELGPGLDDRTLNPRQTNPARHALSGEGKVLAKHKPATINDYFKDYTIEAQDPGFSGRTSEVSVPRTIRVYESSPSHPSPLRSNPSYENPYEKRDIRNSSTQASRRSTAGEPHKRSSILQRSNSIVLNTIDGAKRAIRRRSGGIYNTRKGDPQEVDIQPIGSPRNNSPVSIRRLPNHHFEGTSSSQDRELPLRVTNATLTDSSGSPASIRPSSTYVDFASPEFEDLMDKIAHVEAILHPHAESAFSVSMDKEVLDTPPAVPEITRYSAYVDMVPRIDEEDEEDEEAEEDRHKIKNVEKVERYNPIL